MVAAPSIRPNRTEPCAAVAATVPPAVPTATAPKAVSRRSTPVCSSSMSPAATVKVKEVQRVQPT
jgi:hypothetical protein